MSQYEKPAIQWHRDALMADIGRRTICGALAAHILFGFILPIYASAIPSRTVILLKPENTWLMEHVPPALFCMLLVSLGVRQLKIVSGVCVLIFYAGVASGVPDPYLMFLYLTVFIPLSCAMILMAWSGSSNRHWESE